MPRSPEWGFLINGMDTAKAADEANEGVAYSIRSIKIQAPCTIG